jgi:hypothetical protein
VHFHPGENVWATCHRHGTDNHRDRFRSACRQCQLVQTDQLREGQVNTFVSRTFPPGLGGGATFVTPQLVDVTGGGFCGWTAPADLFNPSNTNAGWDLQLRLLLL